MTITVLVITLLILMTIIAQSGRLPESVLLVGTSPLARRIITEVAERYDDRYQIIAVVAGADDESPDRISELVDFIRPSRIVVAVADRRGHLPTHQLLDARVRGIAVEDAITFYERLTGKIAIEAMTPGSLLASPGFRKSRLDHAFRRVLSFGVSVTALVVLAPVLALIAVAIKLDSPGPIFFVHERLGLVGRRVRLLKFRTMRPADRLTSEWVGDNRDRITHVGAWLRRYRLDELPQLINVVRGELDLIGPRPHPVTNLELFTNAIPYYSLRATVRPGVTGWAQVRQGYANGLEEETEKMRYDLYYIKHMSAWLDVRILFATVRIVLSGREAAVAAPFERPQPAWRAGHLAPAALRSTRTIGGQA